MVKRITAAAVKAVIKRPPWALGDDMLYELCRRHPHHKDREAIWAKVICIGRVYAAALERGRDKTTYKRSDDFYELCVVPEIRKSRIDDWIASVKRQKPGTPKALRAAIVAHGDVTNLFETITPPFYKRSLASKYLHFHAPEHFFLYDSRAVASMRQYGIRMPAPTYGDPQYAWLATRCAELVKRCQVEHGQTLTPRQIDMLLLGSVAKKDRWSGS